MQKRFAPLWALRENQKRFALLRALREPKQTLLPCVLCVK